MDNQTPDCLVCQETPASESNEKMVNAAVAFPSSQLLQGASKSAAEGGAFLEPPTCNVKQMHFLFKKTVFC